MTQEDYDRKIGSKLDQIRHYADSVGFWARRMQEVLETLPARPAWLSMARDKLDQTEQDLRVALAQVKAAQDRYDNLPILIDSRLQAAE